MDKITIKATVTKALVKPMMKDSLDKIGQVSLEIQNIPPEQDVDSVIYLLSSYICSEKFIELEIKPIEKQTT